MIKPKDCVIQAKQALSDAQTLLTQGPSKLGKAKDKLATAQTKLTQALKALGWGSTWLK